MYLSLYFLFSWGLQDREEIDCSPQKEKKWGAVKKSMFNSVLRD
jgi:hypothetical protein